MYAYMLSYVWLTPWAVARQASSSVRFPKQEYWSGLPFPSTGESSQPTDETHVSYIDRQVLYQLCHLGIMGTLKVPTFWIYKES